MRKPCLLRCQPVGTEPAQDARWSCHLDPKSLALTMVALTGSPYPESLGWSFTGKSNQSNQLQQLREAAVTPVCLPSTHIHGSAAET